MTLRKPADVAALPDLPVLTGPCPEVRLLGWATCFRALDSVRHWLPDWRRSQDKRLTSAVARVRFQWPLPNVSRIPTPEKNKERPS